MAMTPAQATARVSGQNNFVKDVPVQGPTDPGMRQSACNHVQTLPDGPGCTGTLMNERISLGGTGLAGFELGLGASGDVWAKLSRDQQTWVMNTLTKLNDLIVKNTGTSCQTWGPSIAAAGGCFQNWYNANVVPINSSARKLRTDGVFDDDSLCALMMTAALDPTNFPTGFPDPEGKWCQAGKGFSGLSTGMKVGIVAGGVAVVGGGVYLATRKKRRR